MKPSSHFWAGVRAGLLLLVGVFPFGLIYGTLALNAGIPPLAGFIALLIFETLFLAR